MNFHVHIVGDNAWNDEYEDLDCIGNLDPTVADNNINQRSDNSIYYNRDTAKCYIAVEKDGAWEDVSSSSHHEKLLFGIDNIHLPPLANITKQNSHDLCDLVAQEDLSFGLIETSTNQARTYNNIIDSDTPTRFQQRAFSLWGDEHSHEEIEILENGLSLNSTSRCNTQNANGLEEEFTSSSNPPVNTPETVTATDLSSFLWKDGESKLIRSVMTGSNVTKKCASRFGVQDHVGNLSEWSFDHFDTVSESINGLLGLKNDDISDTYYSISFGPSLDNTLESSLKFFFEEEAQDFVIDSASDKVGAMNIHLGLPIRPNAINEIGNPNFTDFIFPIGTTSGIETDHLHSDRFTLWSDEHVDGHVADFTDLIDTATSFLDSLFGGGFRDGGGAGVYFLQLENRNKQRPDVGTRCVHKINSSFYAE